MKTVVHKGVVGKEIFWGFLFCNTPAQVTHHAARLYTVAGGENIIKKTTYCIGISLIPTIHRV